MFGFQIAHIKAIIPTKAIMMNLIILTMLIVMIAEWFWTLLLMVQSVSFAQKKTKEKPLKDGIFTETKNQTDEPIKAKQGRSFALVFG